MYIIEDITEENTKRTIENINAHSGQKSMELTLSTYGGCVKSMMLIGSELQKLKDSGTHIIIKCVGTVQSAGTYFLQYADELVADDCMFMTHQCHAGMHGNKSKIDEVMKLDEFFNKKIFDAVKDFLTTEQQENWKKGLDVYFTI